MIAQKLLSVCPVLVTGLLLLARACSEALGLPTPTVAQILAATKTSRSTGYEAMDVLADLLPSLLRHRGRPPKASDPAAAPPTGELTGAVLAYVMAHPGCVHHDSKRQQYSVGFRHFLLEQRSRHAALDLEVFAAAVRVPLGTLKDWLRAPVPSAAPREAEPAPSLSSAASESAPATVEHIETVLDAWSRWEGSFIDFCAHVRDHLLVPFGRAFLSRILEASCVREPCRRDGDRQRRRDSIATRGSFMTFFPGAQWVGDGMSCPVVIDGQSITVNVELHVDASSGAFVGLSVRDSEDSSAVIEAFNDGVAQTGSPPLALLLDNRPSNHTPEVDKALGDTLRMRATPERPENKAHVEGAFGLLSRGLPPLVLSSQNGSHALARGFVSIVVQTWIQAMNHRPRADRKGRSRAELYGDKPTPEQVEQARQELRALADRQERARRTLEARRRPEIMALLDAHFARLGLLDPERHVRIAMAAYPADAIVAAIAIFDGKRAAATLPEDVDARYLLGIARNVSAKREGEQMTHSLLNLRLELKDRILAPLVAAKELVCSGQDPHAVATACANRALATDSPLQRLFWLGALAAVLGALEPQQARDCFLMVARRIHANFAVTARERQDAVLFLAERLLPIA